MTIQCKGGYQFTYITKTALKSKAYGNTFYMHYTGKFVLIKFALIPLLVVYTILLSLTAKAIGKLSYHLISTFHHKCKERKIRIGAGHVA